MTWTCAILGAEKVSFKTPAWRVARFEFPTWKRIPNKRRLHGGWTFATILFVYSVYALPSMRQVFGFTHMSTEVRSLLARVLLGSMGRDPDHVSLWDLTIGHLINAHFVGEFPDGDEWWGGRFTLVSQNSMCGHYVPIIQVSDIRTEIEGRGWYSRLKLPGILRTPDMWVIWDHHRCFFLWIFTCCLMLDSVAALMEDTLRYTYELVQKSIPECSKKS